MPVGQSLKLSETGEELPRTRRLSTAEAVDLHGLPLASCLFSQILIIEPGTSRQECNATGHAILERIPGADLVIDAPEPLG